jgi:hypothetical protein
MTLPPPFLFLVGLGALLGLRRRTTWMLLIAFALGLVPALLGPNGVSSRRLIPAVIIAPFFMGVAVDAVRPSWRRFAAVVVTVAVLLWGPATYFSDRWTHEDKFGFCGADCTLAPPERLEARRGEYAGRRLPASCKDIGVGLTLP